MVDATDIPNRIYFDTEFTCLDPGAALISVGLVSVDGNELYVELNDTFVESDCSDFCRTTVLPLLEGGSARKSLAALRLDLYAWLVARGPSVQLVCDSPRDVTQIQALFPGGLPCNCECLVLSRWNRLRRRIVNFRGRLYRKHCLRHHHALDDAKVNRLIFG